MMHIIPRLSSEESRLRFTNHQSFLTVHTPAIFGAIIGSGSRVALFWAYCFAGAVMIIAAVVEAILRVKAER
jgi:hypothetical protein